MAVAVSHTESLLFPHFLLISEPSLAAAGPAHPPRCQTLLIIHLFMYKYEVSQGKTHGAREKREKERQNKEERGEGDSMRGGRGSSYSPFHTPQTLKRRGNTARNRRRGTHFSGEKIIENTLFRSQSHCSK